MRASRSTSLFVAALAFTALTTTITFAQRATPAEVAAKFTGSWKINFDLSPQFAPRPGGGRQGGGGGRQGGMPSAPSFAVGATRLPSAPAFQRGGPGGGGGGQMTPEQQAMQRAMMGLRQVSDTLAITATADSVTLKDARGERSYAVDNKTVRMDLGGVQVNVKSRWDRNTLKQEFVAGEDRITQDWEINNEGTRINFKMLISNMQNPGPGTEAKAVYDKQP